MCLVYASTVCICVHMYMLNMHVFMCTCVHVCTGPEAMSQDKTGFCRNPGVLGPWALAGGASVDTLMLGTYRVNARLSCPEEGHMLL